MKSAPKKKLPLEKRINRLIGQISISEIESNRELRKKIVRLRSYLEVMHDPCEFLNLKSIDLKYGDY